MGGGARADFLFTRNLHIPKKQISICWEEESTRFRVHSLSATHCLLNSLSSTKKPSATLMWRGVCVTRKEQIMSHHFFIIHPSLPFIFSLPMIFDFDKCLLLLLLFASAYNTILRRFQRWHCPASNGLHHFLKSRIDKAFFVNFFFLHFLHNSSYVHRIYLISFLQKLFSSALLGWSADIIWDFLMCVCIHTCICILYCIFL